MNITAVTLPRLPAWLQQLSGILPLSALVDFIDVATKLHIFELNGSVPLWNWPVTPIGARLLLSKQEDVDNVCCLDTIGRSPTLHCIDGRNGDSYPGSTPATTRFYLSTPRSSIWLSNGAVSTKAAWARKQTLKIVCVRRLDGAHASPKKGGFPDWLCRARFLASIEASPRYKLVSMFGWVIWLAMIFVSVIAGLYTALAYLFLMPLTGLIIKFTHGSPPRKLLDERTSPFTRLVVATDSINGADWMAFYGNHYVINALLNRPLNRIATTSAPRALQICLRCLIGGQWTLALGSCALQDWNALFISFWIITCACISSYGYSPEQSVRDWLERSCYLAIDCISAEFSSRRSMLSALVYLNPETEDGHTEWIDPIMKGCKERREWESALLSYVSSGDVSLSFVVPNPFLSDVY